MGILGKIFGKGAKGLLDGAKGILDEVITTDSERAEAKYKLEALVKEYEAKAQAELSKRHKYDMQSDSWLSKNIRPTVLLYSLFIITVFALLEGFIDGFSIPSGYIGLMEILLTSATVFYFGAREYGKSKINESMMELKKEREKTIQKKVERGDEFEMKDLPKVSLSSDE